MTEKKQIRLMVVDDHPIVRQGIKSLLELEHDYVVIGEAESVAEGLKLVSENTPDAAIIDIALKGSDGLELIKSIRAMDYEFPIVVMSMHDESLYAQRVLRAGGNGYIMKKELSDNLVKALQEVSSGGIYVSETMRQKFLHHMSGKGAQDVSLVEKLSDRELEVFRLIGQGYSTRSIAESLHLSIKTIETYRSHIKEKLNLANATELVRSATNWNESQY